MLIVTGKIESADGQELTLIIEDVQRLEDAFPMKAQKLSITLSEDKAEIGLLEDLFALLSRTRENVMCILICSWQMEFQLIFCRTLYVFRGRDNWRINSGIKVVRYSGI